MAKYDDKTIRNFEAYLNLQKSGEVNMVSSKVQDVLGISKEEHRFILDNYSDILTEFNALKVVDEVLSDAKARVDGKGNDDKGLDGKSVEPAQRQQ